jgi:hypothetical protein
MSPSPKILKFLVTVRHLSPSATHSRVAYAVWGGRRGTVAWNSVLDQPQMAGMVTIARPQRRGRKGKMQRGRPSLRYTLTRAGRKLLRDLLKAQAIAQETARNVAQAADEAAQRARYDLVRKAQEKLQAVMDARPKHPSVKRHRSAADRAVRQKYFDAKMYEQGKVRDANGKYQPIQEVQAAEQKTAHVLEPETLALDENRDWQRYISLLARPSGIEPPLPTPTGLDTNTTALLTRIERAGYRTQGGKVLFDSNWIDPQEWLRRMPGCLD